MSESVPPGPGQYNQDGLVTIHSHDFMESPTFQAAYQRGVTAAGTDYNWHWRVHIGLWAAAMASELPGDFVECAVNRGFVSSAIMQFLDWDGLGKQFYHVRGPLQGLKECHRVLGATGHLLFTVPLIVGRLTRPRPGLARSYHGAAGCTDPGMLVHTEFGADAWTMVVEAGFSSCTLVPYMFPSGLAIIGERE